MVDTPTPTAVNEPTFLQYSQGKQSSSSSTSILGAVGDLVKGGVNAIDEVLKTSASEDVRTKVQAVQDQTISNYMLAGNPPADVPPAVNAELERAQKLQQANRAGVVRDSYYNLQIDQIARELRYKYSGYKDYIDGRIQDMTGIKPASALIKSLKQDVYDTMPAEDKRTETVRQDLIKAGIDIAAMEAKRGSAVPRPEMESMLANENKVKIGMANAKAMMDVQEGITKNNKTAFKETLNEALGQDFNAGMKNNFSSRGVSFDNIVSMATKFQNDPNSYTASMQEELKTNIGAARLDYEQRLMKRLHDNSSGKSLVDAGKMDVKEIEDTRKYWMGRFDSMFEPLFNKQWGAFAANARIVETSLASTSAKALNDQHVLAFASMKELYGPQVASTMLTIKGGPSVSTLNDVMNKTAKEVAVMNVVGKPNMSLAQADGDIRRQNNPYVNTGKVSQDTVETLVGMVLDPKQDVVMRSRAASGLFAQENVGWIGRIQVKDSNGNVDLNASRAKQLELFQKLTTQDITNNIKEMSTREPRLVDNYTNFALNTGLTVNKSVIDSLKSEFVDKTRSAKVSFNPQSGEFFAERNIANLTSYDKQTMSPTQQMGEMARAEQLARDMNVVTRQLTPIIKLRTNDTANGIRELYSRTGLNIDALSPASGDKLGGRLPSKAGALGAPDSGTVPFDFGQTMENNADRNNNQNRTPFTYEQVTHGISQQYVEASAMLAKDPTNTDLQKEVDAALQAMKDHITQGRDKFTSNQLISTADRARRTLVDTPTRN